MSCHAVPWMVGPSIMFRPGAYVCARGCAGRLVIELFDDLVPMAASHFRNRCLPGSAAGLAGTSAHKLIPHYALFAGHQ